MDAYKEEIAHDWWSGGTVRFHYRLRRRHVNEWRERAHGAYYWLEVYDRSKGRWSKIDEHLAVSHELLRVLGKTPAGEPTSDDAREGLRAGDEGRQSPDRDA